MGGQPVDRSDYRKLPVLLLLHTENEEAGFYPCSATMLNSNTFLTAAHCVENERVFIQRTTDLNHEVRRNRKGYRIKKENIFIHPQYDSSTHSFDFAILKTDRDYFRSSEIQYPRLNSPVRAGPFTFFGYGNSRFTSGMGRLRTLTRNSEEQIAPDENNEGYLEFDQSGGLGVCVGDSGGPVFVRDADNNYVLLAIHIAARNNEGEARCSKSGLSGQIEPVLSWIQSYL